VAKGEEEAAEEVEDYVKGNWGHRDSRTEKIWSVNGTGWGGVFGGVGGGGFLGGVCVWFGVCAVVGKNARRLPPSRHGTN